MCVGIALSGVVWLVCILHTRVVTVSNKRFALRLTRSGVGLWRLSGSAEDAVFLYNIPVRVVQGAFQVHVVVDSGFEEC
jgi:hypothetical protein